jgi:hypothetical protein
MPVNEEAMMAADMIGFMEFSKWACALRPVPMRFQPSSARRQDLSALWRDRDNALLGAVSKAGGQRNQVRTLSCLTELVSAAKSILAS